MGYGTGAIMAVPGEDQRDWDFAKAHGLPIIETVAAAARAGRGEAYTGDGVKINSGFLDGLTIAEAKRKAIDWLVERSSASGRSTTGSATGASAASATGARRSRSSTARSAAWCPSGRSASRSCCPRTSRSPARAARRSPTCRGSSTRRVPAAAARPGARRTRWTPSWSPPGTSSATARPGTLGGLSEADAVHYWMPVDQYIGGIEHAVLHLLYARFYTKVLRDLGYFKLDEPFRDLLTPGHGHQGRRQDVEVQGQRRDPDDLIGTYGADTGRVFSLFAAPPEKDLDWNDHGVEGASRFLNRVWRFVQANRSRRSQRPEPRSRRPLGGRARVPAHDPRDDPARHDRHRATSTSTPPSARSSSSSTRARLRDGVARPGRGGGAGQPPRRGRRHAASACSAPFAPHLAEELWAQLGHRESLFRARGPPPTRRRSSGTRSRSWSRWTAGCGRRLVVSPEIAEDRLRTEALADEKVLPVARRRARSRGWSWCRAGSSTS